MTSGENENHPGKADHAAEKSERIANEGQNVAERIRELVIEVVENRGMTADRMQQVAREVMDGAVEGVSRLKPEQQESVLHDVMDGLGEGFKVAANAARLAFEETHSRGRAFAREDVNRTLNDLKTIQGLFTETVTTSIKNAGNETIQQSKALFDHAKRTASSIQPSVQSAIDAARRDPLGLAAESAKAGIDGSRMAAGMFLQTMAGFLQGAADVVTGPTKKKSSEE